MNNNKQVNKYLKCSEPVSVLIVITRYIYHGYDK